MNARHAHERGAVSVIFALLVVFLLIPIGAIVADVGFWYTNGKKVQNTADAAALAAASMIDNAASVRIAGGQYVTRNLADTATEDCASPVSTRTYCVEYPYIPDSGPNMGVPQPDEVEVRVKHEAPAFFGRIFGLIGVDSTRRAVAEQWKIPGTMALYVNSQDCDAGESLEFNGENMHIAGWVHTEGGLYVSVAGPPQPQPNFTADKGTMAYDINPPQTRCQESINPYNQVADFVPGHPDYLPEGTDPIDWPVFYTASQFGFYSAPTETSPPINAGTAQPAQCRFKGETIEIEDAKVKVSGGSFSGDYDYSGNQFPDGIYCATKEFKIVTTQRRTGNITVLAQKITVGATANTLGYDAAGNPDPLSAYAGAPDPVLFFTVPNVTPTTADDGPPPAFNKSIHCKDFGGSAKYPGEETTLNSDGMRWDGLIFHPCGRVLVNQSNSVGRGSIVADRIKVNGSNFSFTGNNNFSATIEVGLVE